METFDERLEYGKALEYVAIARFLEANIESDEIPCENATENMISGDIYIIRPISKEPIRIDAKRTCKVSSSSVIHFTGAYYLFSPSGSLNSSKWWIIPSTVVKSYCDKINIPGRFNNGNEYYNVPVDMIRHKVSFNDFLANDCVF